MPARRTAPARLLAALPSSLVLASLVLAVVVGLAACGTPVPSRAELVDALTRSGVPRTEARCAASALVEELSDEQMAAVVERGASGLPADDPDRTDDANDRVRAALLACRDAAAATSTTTTSPTSTTTPSTATTAATASSSSTTTTP